MSQYRIGTIKMINGDATVEGTGTTWSGEIDISDLFKAKDEDVIYQVASVTNNTNLELSTPYSGITRSGELYQINRDFTPNLNLPLISAGDIDWPAFLNNAITLIDARINQSLLTSSSPTYVGVTLSGLTASLPVFTNASKALVSNPMTGTGSVVMSISPALVTPALGTPSSGVLSNCTAGTEGAKGVLALATTAEVVTGTDTAKAVTAAGVQAKIASSISDGTTTHAPDGNSVFDALALKAPLASPTFTTQITTPVVYGSSAADGDITIEGTSSATKTTSYVILQPTTGNVGIGTTLPAAILHINNDFSAATYERLLQGRSSGNNSFGIGVGGNDTYISAAGGGGMHFATNSNLGVTGTSVPTNVTMSILNTGNVGIGTTLPAAILHINNDFSAATYERLLQGRSSGNNSFGIGVGGNDTYISAAGAGGMHFATNSNLGVTGTSVPTNVTMSILNTGNVGIGTTVSEGIFEVGQVTIKGTTNDGATQVQVWRDSDEANVANLNTNGDFYSAGDVSALTFTDRTPVFDGDAISAINAIKSIDGELDHNSLHPFLQKTIIRRNNKFVTEVPIEDALETVTIEEDETEEVHVFNEKGVDTVTQEPIILSSEMVQDGFKIEKGDIVPNMIEEKIIKKTTKEITRQRTDVKFDSETGKFYLREVDIIETPGRNIGATVSILIKAVQELTAEIERLKKAKK